MKPKLKISQLTNLHDARYCAAVGIYLQAFSLRKGDDRKISVEVLSEIKPWLSGPEIIGEFGYEIPEEIWADFEAAGLDYVSIPMDYPAESASLLPDKLIFRSENEMAAHSEGLKQALDLARQFPNALLELHLTDLDADLWSALAEAGILDRSLLHFPNPDPIWTLLQKNGVQPLGFSLGEYVEEADGQLDYEVCDDLVERFNELVPQD